MRTVLSRLNILTEEFIAMVKLLYSDFSVDNLKQLLQSFGLETLLPEKLVQSVLVLDSTIDLTGVPKVRVKRLDQLIQQCDILEERQMNLNRQWVKILFMLNKGDFSLIRQYNTELASLQCSPASISNNAKESGDHALVAL